MDFEGRRRRGAKPILTPLIDVVFLLLIFFLLTGTFMPPDPFGVQPPLTDSDLVALEGPVMVHIAADGRIAVGNRVVSAAELEAALAERVQAGSLDAITVKADSATPSGAITGVLGLTRRAGVPRARLVTVPSEQAE